jgi:uncharacterized membrane protein
MHAISADTDHILTHTYIYMHTYSYTHSESGGSKIPTAVSHLLDTVRFLQIHVNTGIYLLPIRVIILTHTCRTCPYLHSTYLQIGVLTLKVFAGFCRYRVGICKFFVQYHQVLLGIVGMSHYQHK